MKKAPFSLLLISIFIIALLLVFQNQKKIKEWGKGKELARRQFLEEIKPGPGVEIAGIILCSHFNERENKGPLGEFGAWSKDPSDDTQGCYDSFTPLIKRGTSGYALKIDYDVDSPNTAYNGIWFKLGNIDLSGYKYLALWVKGDEKKGFTKNFKIELKNAVGRRGTYYLTDIDKEWKQFVIPLEKFRGMTKFDNMEELVLVFEDWKVSAKEGTLYVDDIYFTKEAILDKPLTEIYKTNRGNISRPDILKLSDTEFLELLQRKAFVYFWVETNPQTGLTKDKASNFKDDTSKVASIAAVGFALTSYPIAIEKGWLTREEGLERTLNTLLFFRDKMENVHGFFYHFVGMNDGKRVWNCELSSIDTALFLGGALFAGEYFGGEIKELAEGIYERVEWNWMLAEGDTLCMGWTPEKGFLQHRWNKYGEESILYLLAIGSPTHPIPASAWDKIRRPIFSYQGYTSIASPPLFTHQYSHIWIDFRNRHDRHADYFKSSVNATLANRQFCIDNKDNSKTFNENSWGLTACESPAGYRAYGAPPGYANYDGTVAFTAAGGSVPFAPKECISALRYMYQNYKEHVWGKYGFVDSFNRDKDWYSDIAIGIDQGPILIMIENYLTGIVWEYFMKNKYIQKAMQLVGFEVGEMELKPEEPPLITARYEKGLPEKDEFYSLSPEKTLEFGAITKYPEDLDCDFNVTWDEDNLYFLIMVKDNEVVAEEAPQNLYKQDCVEIYITPPEDKLLEWGNPSHFQFGFAPSGKDGAPIKYAWFQKQDYEEIEMQAQPSQNGYELRARIPFKVLNIEPKAQTEINFSIAVHDYDRKDNTGKCKFNLFFMPFYEEGYSKGFALAKLKLVKEAEQ